MRLQITINGTAYQAEVEVLEDEHDRDEPAVAMHDLGARLPLSEDYGQSAPAPIDDGVKDYFSPVTGLVTRTCVNPGQLVKRNDPLIVLEAMKMETTITAHSAGRVKSLTVASGDSVKLGQLLIELE